MSHTILVTGGTGYIGSHTTIELIQHGYNVVIADNLYNSSANTIDRIEAITGVRPVFYPVCLTDKKATAEIFEKHPDISGVIHFAALKAVGESMQIPLIYYHNNLISLLNLLECMNDFGIANIIFSSSCTVYGASPTLPVTETATIGLDSPSPYGKSKQMCETILKDSSNTIDHLNVISLRYFNPVGAHPSAKIGELPNGTPNNLVPFITQTAAGVREKLSIFGKDYNTPDGTCQRDYIHVVDLADAHIKALERLLNSENIDKFEVFNIGTGTPLSVLEIVKTFEAVTGVSVNYEFAPRRAGDTDAIWADTAKAKDILGWTPKYSLNEMLSSAWDWEQNYRKKTAE